MKLQDIKIVLVETTHPGNIGASARAMKNMGLSQMLLVNPQCAVGVQLVLTGDEYPTRAPLFPGDAEGGESCSS